MTIISEENRAMKFPRWKVVALFLSTASGCVAILSSEIYPEVSACGDGDVRRPGKFKDDLFSAC